MQIRIAILAAAGLMTTAAVAQTPPAAAAAQTPTTKGTAPKPARTPVVRTAKSLDCSKQADAKSLHGKPRKSFMSSCKKA